MSNQSRFVVTGASGELGRLAVAALVQRVGAGSVTAMVRDPARAAGLFPHGVGIVQGDYENPETLDAAFKGVKRVLLISSNAVGARVSQHANVIAAAKRAGVARLAYTSVLRADSSTLSLAEEHRQTEALIVESGLAHTLLRNGWYTENYAASIPPALQHGAFVSSAGTGRLNTASRLDYAEAAAVALADDTATGRVVYELAGDISYTLADFAAELSRQVGRTIPYIDMPEGEYRNVLIGAGLPEPFAALLAQCETAAAGGALYSDDQSLSRLLGRPTTPIADTIAAALK